MQGTRDYYTAAAARRRLGITRAPWEKLVTAKMVRPVGRGWSIDDVDALAAQRQARTYQRRRVDEQGWLTGRIARAVPVNAPDYDSSLVLSHSNLRAHALQQLGRPLSPGEEITGWWAIDDHRLSQLVDERALLLGITGGFVHEAARITEYVGMHPSLGRRALVVRMLAVDELAGLRGYVSDMTPTGFYVEVPVR